MAHQSQVFAIPDAIPDRAAVLIEPFSVAVHAVLRDPPPDDAKVLIIGSGTIGLLVLAALRLLRKTCDVTVLARHPKQVELAERFGATRVLRRKSAGEAAQEVTGARRFKLIKGKLLRMPAGSTGFSIASARRSRSVNRSALPVRMVIWSWSAAPRKCRSWTSPISGRGS